MAGQTIGDRIVEKLDNSFGMTRAELAQSLGLTREGIRKAVASLLDRNIIHRETDESGIETFTVIRCVPAEPSMVPCTIGTYEEGFAMGYAAAQKASYAEAFHEGKMSVLNKLRSLLI